MGEVTYGPESRGSPGGQRICRILSSVTHTETDTLPSFSCTHIEVALEVLAGLLHFTWEDFSQVKMEKVQKSATGTWGRCKLSCVSLGRMGSFKRGWYQQSDSGKTTQQRCAVVEPTWQEMCTAFNWLGRTCGNPAEGWHQQHPHLWQMHKKSGSLKTWFWSFAGTPSPSRF